MPDKMTRDEAAAHCKVSTRTIDRWAVHGHIRKIKPAGRRAVLFLVEDLDAMNGLTVLAKVKAVQGGGN